MFKPGSIRKIEVKNFVTYSHAELYPGPNLNMIIGPNGTGKSTMVAAIILGLGGNPKVVGRGSKVSEYVKHGCQEATVHIHLQGEREDAYVKVTRMFNTQDKTVWMLGNQRATAKDVQDCIREYSIQVDNLCQFLPQDRVQDFAKLNQQQLLKEIQLALCRDDLLNKQKNLIEHRDRHKLLLENVSHTDGRLQELQDANLRLEGKIENFNRKKTCLAEIQHVERKVAWVQYDAIYDKMTEVKRDLTRATEIYEGHKTAAKPMEAKIQEAKNKAGKMQQISANINRSIRDTEGSSRAALDRIEQVKRQIRDVEGDMNVKLAEIEQRSQEITTTISKIEQMRNAQRELVNKCGKDEEVQAKVQKITDQIRKFESLVTELQKKRDGVVLERQNRMAQLRAFDNEATRLENVKQQRLTCLQRLDRDAYEAVMWLRNNKHLFKGEVFEPIMLELNVLNPKNAVYVENVIAVRDRLAFTCTLKEDMNTLIRSLRGNKRLNINVLHSGDTGESFQPSIPIEQLRRYGLYTYLNSLFTAPDPIMRYLCRNYRIHEIPVGTLETNNHYEDVPRQVKVFFSENQRFSVTYSKYTGARSTRQNEIRSDGGLSISMNVLHLERLRGQINDIRQSIDKFDVQIREHDTQIGLINESMDKINEELKYIKSIKQQARAIESRIVTMQQKVREMQEAATNGDSIRAQARHKTKKLIRAMLQPLSDLTTAYKTLASLSTKSTLSSLKVEKARSNAAYLENKIQELRAHIRESETTLSQVREAYANAKGQAKAALQKAKGLSKNFTPDDEGFDEFRESFDKLPADLPKLEEEKKRLISMIDCLNAANDEEMAEYEARTRQIKDLEEAAENDHVELGRVTNRMAELQEEWLGPLEELVANINRNFAGAFERMGCAGEVSINPGADEKDFDKYGLRIKVTYRNGEPLQELNNVVQSGGERAVATAIFMLALQELTPVPFRCVDEINQGMDANNERRVFDLLVELTSEASSSQYFLITPKLVPNLNYSRTTMIHFVHNGPFIEEDRKWGMSKMCNPQRVMIH